jgi:DNA-binding CsgD family transcriptional regulator
MRWEVEMQAGLAYVEKARLGPFAATWRDGDAFGVEAATLGAIVPSPPMFGRLRPGGQPGELHLYTHEAHESLIVVSFSLGPLRSLSHAELEVARWAGSGLSNADIARERQTSTHTVAKQMASVRSKLGIDARLELATIPELSAWSPTGSGPQAPEPSPDPSLPDHSFLWAKGPEVEGAEAVRLWREIVAGRWSTLTGVDAAGTRYAVLRRESANPVDWLALGKLHWAVLALLARGEALKVVAMKLGLAPSTVSSALGSARRRLGFASPSQLLRAYCAIADVRDPSEKRRCSDTGASSTLADERD